MSSPIFTPRKSLGAAPGTIFPNTPSTISQLHRRYNDFPPVSKTLTPIKSINSQYEIPEIKKVEKRIVNKELQTRKIIMNVLILLVSNLMFKFFVLLFNQFEISNTLKGHIDLVYFAEKGMLILKLLVFYNLVTGIYGLCKKNDEFRDIKLTPKQRQLFGLPIISEEKNVPEKAVQASLNDAAVLQTSSQPNLSVKSTNTNPLASNPSSIFNKDETHVNKQHSLIASPMSSPRIQRFLPTQPAKSSTSLEHVKPEQSFISKLNSGILPSQQSLNTNISSGTPTYIPSPKYYYRTDSPSRSRRRG